MSIGHSGGFYVISGKLIRYIDRIFVIDVFNLLFGFFRGDLEEAEAEGATYIGAGPVWETPSKPDAEPAIGLDGIRSIADAVAIPVVAIGGIDASNARACIDAGASGIAVVRAAADMAELSAAL